MPSWLNRLFGSKAPEQWDAARHLRLQPMPPVTYAVGDIHGHLDLYRKLEARIAAHAATLDSTVLVVLLGDLVDRGPNSAGVLDFVTAPAPEGVQRLALMGNHEEKMMAFVDAPAAHRDWLSWGGAETLLSYGIAPDADRWFDLPEKDMRHRLAAHIPDEHLQFLRALPLSLHMGPYFLCHAGIDPDKSLAAQTQRDVLWTRGVTAPPPGDTVVVHGHTPTDRVRTDGRYINVDTGAYHSGRLSAVRLSPDATPEVIEVTTHDPA